MVDSAIRRLRLLKLWLLWLAFLDPTLAKGSEASGSSYQCMADHLREAKAINLERMPKYVDLTDGASRWVSWILIGSEMAGIPFATLVEYLNEPLAKAGVNILCEDFISMEKTPPFLSRASDPPLPVDQFSADLGWDDMGELWQLTRSRSYGQLAARTDAVLAELKLVPTYHCMYRHILESIRLAAANAEGQLARARAAGLSSEAERVIDMLMISQVGVLPLALYLDKLAAPIHARGIPIICQDVPPIPAPSP